MIGLEDSEEDHEEPKHGGQPLTTALEPGQPPVQVEEGPCVGTRADSTGSLRQPARCRGAWDPGARGDQEIAGLLDDTDQPVVV